MTACVNKHTKRVAAVVTASLVGALSLGVAPVAAVAATDDANMGDVWNDGTTFTWNVEKIDGEYTIQKGDDFILTDITDPYGDPVSMSDVTVVYVADDDGTAGLSAGDTLYTETPDVRGSYLAVVIPEKVFVPKWASEYGQIIGSTANALTQPFSVVAKSLDGASAYQGDDVSDTTFTYTGYSFNDGKDDGADIHFVDGAGNKLTDKDINVDWKDANGNDWTGDITEAGDYKAVLTPAAGSDYEGTVTVDVKISPIDLAGDTFTVTPVANDDLKLILNADGNQTYVDWPNTESAAAANKHDFSVYVNGDKVNTDKVWLTVTGGTKWDPATNQQVDVNNNYGGVADAELNLNVIKGDAASPNFVDDNAHGRAKLIVAGELVDSFYYDGDNLGSTLRVDLSKGESFDPKLITAEKASDREEVPVSVTVYDAKGDVVKDYTQPGSYKVVVEVKVPKDFAYAGSKTFTLNVASKRFSEQPKAFASIDGVNVSKASPEYDGEAIVPTVAVKAGSAVVDPADYTVTYTDEDGNVVDSIVEPGKYTGTVDFGSAYYMDHGEMVTVQDAVFTFEVTKAQLRSAKADKDLYPETGEAVTPKFTAYNQDDLDGLSLEIDPAETGVTYYEAVWGVKDFGNWWTSSDDVYGWVKGSKGIKASDLKKGGKYVAEVTAPADDPHFQGSVTSEMFEIGEYAKYSDVEPYAWYAEAVAWASEAGVVTGYDDTTFGPMDNATREQVAVMLYRYAKGQGKDVSVSDVDGTLAKYKDGDQVSDWAKDAMAWAVENGIFGVGTDELWAKQNIQRAAVATIAVRFQPEALPEA